MVSEMRKMPSGIRGTSVDTARRFKAIFEWRDGDSIKTVSITQSDLETDEQFDARISDSRNLLHDALHAESGRKIYPTEIVC